MTVEDWATHTVHDHMVEHWRVTALLARDAEKLWSVLVKERELEIPESIQTKMAVLRRRLELVDYFLSGLRQ